MPADDLPPVFKIDNPETLKIVSDPLRLRILEALGYEPTSVKQIAARIGMPPGKLYYHMNLLEKHGILYVSETRVVSGIIEKLYRPVAESFEIDRSLIRSEIARDDETSFLNVMLDTTRNEIVEGVRRGIFDLSDGEDSPDRMRFRRSKLFLTPDQVVEMHRRMEALVEEFDFKGDPPPGLKPYRLVLMLYPAVELDRDDSSTEENQKGAE